MSLDLNTTTSPLNDFFDSEIFAGVVTWHALTLICSVVLIILVFLCCCISFRIPRTKQEIEADYIRKSITRRFRRQLDVISDSEMEELDLVKAIEKVQFHLMSEEEKAASIKLKSGPPNEELENMDTTKPSESLNERLISSGTDSKKCTPGQPTPGKLNSTLSTSCEFTPQEAEAYKEMYKCARFHWLRPLFMCMYQLGDHGPKQEHLLSRNYVSTA